MHTFVPLIILLVSTLPRENPLVPAPAFLAPGSARPGRRIEEFKDFSGKFRWEIFGETDGENVFKITFRDAKKYGS